MPVKIKQHLSILIFVYHFFVSIVLDFLLLDKLIPVVRSIYSMPHSSQRLPGGGLLLARDFDYDKLMNIRFYYIGLTTIAISLLISLLATIVFKFIFGKFTSVNKKQLSYSPLISFLIYFLHMPLLFIMLLVSTLLVAFPNSWLEGLLSYYHIKLYLKSIVGSLFVGPSFKYEGLIF